jgi:hypothetical protein
MAPSVKAHADRQRKEAVDMEVAFELWLQSIQENGLMTFGRGRTPTVWDLASMPVLNFAWTAWNESARQVQRQRSCLWVEVLDEEGTREWRGACGDYWRSSPPMKPSQVSKRWCSYCGGRIEEQPLSERGSDE